MPQLPTSLQSIDLLSVGIGLAVGLLMAVVAHFKARRRAARVLVSHNERIADLMHAANAIATQKNFSIRAIPHSKDEMGLMVATFNQMVAQIEVYDQRRTAQLRRAEEATVAKGTFLATMSHEIRTPINGILGMAQLFDRTKLTREQSEYVDTILDSAEHLLSIINDILDFSKGEAGAFDMETIPFSPTDLVRKALDTVSPAANEKGIDLVARISPDVPKEIRGDPARLRQVLLNLLSNAVKFTEAGEVSVRIGVVAHHGTSAELRFEVRDTGIGIPQDRLNRLFQSFTQVDASNTRRYGGTGLGLAISKRIIDAMGGSIYVKSKEGVGSIFGFRSEFQCEESTELTFANAPAGLRVLLVEEDDGARDQITNMLGGNDVVACRAGIEARRHLLNRAGSRGFDLVLLDTRQAQDFGIAASDDIEFPEVPLILLSSLDQLGAHSSMEWGGPSASLARPLKRNELLWCVDDLLNRGPLPSIRTPKTTSSISMSVDESDVVPVQLPESNLEGMRILVVEDHPVNQKITTRFLEKLGVKWDLAENGQEAVDRNREGEFDLILMDLQMPVLDGLEATRIIRSEEIGSEDRIPIIAMTAAVLEEDQRQCEEAGFDDWVPKPVKLSALEERLRAWALRVSQREALAA